ncbi:hypothetical protein [Pantoea rwandensis]|uniref:Uncharacterized protein n=1 Tax=Pantoea rwandensis TaxID=1076550 RepID=A0ABM5RM59_9GAMM|nr:hypothetical protein [Pantoea rwandensis]AIR87099.1 hypothetical protein LH22_17140 [Pantoea rwandensis]
MKTQLEIVNEAIARLEKMSREEFVQTLVSVGLADEESHHHEIFSHSIFVHDLVEIEAVRPVQRLNLIRDESTTALSFAF